MTVEEWAIVERKLSVPYGSVKLEIDGYNAEVVCTPTKNPLKYELVVFIDGKFKVEWINNDCEIRRRFCCKHKTSLLTAEQKKKLKRERKAVREEIEKQMTSYYYYPFWNSFGSMKSHFIKNNKSIELLNK